MAHSFFSAGALVASLGVAACSPAPAGPEDVSDADAAADGAGDAADDAGEIAPSRPPFLMDERGRSVHYLGVNVAESSKQAPDLLPPLTDDDYALLRSWGVTLVRFLIFWEGVEPERGVYDDAYLASVRVQLDRLQSFGFDVLLDMHQDIWGRGFGFAGAPRWTCDESRYAAFRLQSPWFLNYMSPEVTACFDGLWHDRALWDRYRDAWTHAAGALGDHPAVIGFDLMNEPLPGTIGGAAFERDYLASFYHHVGTALAGSAASRGLFLEPSVSYDFSPRTFLPTFGAGEVFAPHYYPASISGGAYVGHEEEIAADLADVVGDAATLGAPLVLGEFGISNDAPDGPAYLSDVIDAILETGGSALAWDFSRGGPGAFALLDAEGNPYPLAAALDRPYVHRVTGTLVSTAYDRATRTLETTWSDAGDAGGIVVAVPSGACTAEVTSATDPAGSWTVESDGGQRLSIVPAVASGIAVHTFRVRSVCPAGGP